MAKFAPSILLGLSLMALSACGGDTTKMAADKIDTKLLGKDNNKDPVLSAALEDQIMVDPALTGQSNANAIRPTNEPMQSPIPAEAGAHAAGDRQRVTLGQRATEQAKIDKTNFNGCGIDVDYSMAWAAKLPEGLSLYPKARVEEAAGSDTDRCRLRAVTFTSTASPQALIDYYLGASKRVGYVSEMKIDGADRIVAGVRSDGAAYYIILAPRQGGGTTADLVANRGI
jgi:hypothetical protein